MYRTFSMELAGRNLTIETGQLAQLANGAALVRYGDTVILSTANIGYPEEGIDFFPLSVDYEENCMQSEKYPADSLKRGSRLKRAVLTAVIDRPIRPLFPERLEK